MGQDGTERRVASVKEEQKRTLLARPARLLPSGRISPGSFSISNTDCIE